MVDTRTDYTVIIDHTVTIDLIVIIDHKADITTMTETDHRAITESMKTETFQITGIVVTATTEVIDTTIIVIPNVQLQILVITKDRIHDHHINIHKSPYQFRSPYNRDRNSNSNNGSRYHSNDRNRG